MIYFIAKIIYFFTGWKLNNQMPPDLKKCVMIASPHTSNWDIFYARIAFLLMHIPVKFTVKIEWLRFPFKWFMVKVGAIGIDRSPKTGNTDRKSMVEAMADLFHEKNELVIMITPEGTRSLSKKWKTGFYYVAKSAKVPIALGYLDYKNKVAGVGKVIYPSNDFKKDMQEIMLFYKDIPARYPEKFSVDEELIKG